MRNGPGGLARVGIADNSAKGLAESAQKLEKATGGKCIAASADVRQPAAMKKAVEDTIAKFGRIDFVICGMSARTSLVRH